MQRLCHKCYIEKYGIPTKLNKKGKELVDHKKYPFYRVTSDEYCIEHCDNCGPCIIDNKGQRLSKMVEYPLGNSYTNNHIYAYVIYANTVSLNSGYTWNKWSGGMCLTSEATFLKKSVNATYKATNYVRNWNPPEDSLRAVYMFFYYPIDGMFRKNGGLKRKDISNMFKFPEDSIMDAFGGDDKDNLYIVGQNKVTAGKDPYILVFIQHFSKNNLEVTIENMYEGNFYMYPVCSSVFGKTIDGDPIIQLMQLENTCSSMSYKKD